VNARRLSLWLSVAGGSCLVAAAALLVSISLGETSSTFVDASGHVSTDSHRTASVFGDSPRLALMWILVAGTFALLAVLAIRFGGIVGSAVVLVITGMTLLASMLTIGIFLAPGILLLDASAWAAIVDRGEQRRLGSLPAPPPPPPPPGVVAE